MMPILELQNVSAKYGDFQALFDISLKLEPGEVISVIGANGAGKSSLLKTIAGNLRISSGDIKYKGESLGNSSAYKRVASGISMVPEGRRIFSSLTVEENLKVGGYSKRPGPWNISSICELFPILEDRWTRKGIHCSGGELQILAIGRALMANPDLLLIDEASLGLAPIVVRQVYESIPKIKNQGTSVLIVEQDVRQAMEVSSHITVLLGGSKVLEGNANEIKLEDIKKAYFGMEDAHGLG